MNRSHTHTTHDIIYTHRSNEQMSFYLYCRNSRTKNQHSYDENVTIFKIHFFRENGSPSPARRWPDQYLYILFLYRLRPMKWFGFHQIIVSHLKCLVSIGCADTTEFVHFIIFRKWKLVRVDAIIQTSKRTNCITRVTNSDDRYSLLSQDKNCISSI